MWKIFLPHLIAWIVASKSSSVKTRSELWIAALHPDPIARPASEILSESTSLIPSPVTATFFPKHLSPLTKIALSKGVALAKTLSCS